MRDKQNGRQTELETNSQIEISYFVTIRIPNTFSYRSVATYISYMSYIPTSSYISYIAYIS